MAQQFARMLRAAVAVQVGGRSGRREALRARADGHGHHVLLQPLVVADARIAAAGHEVHEAVLGDDVELDVGKGRQEVGHQRRQHKARRAHRHVQAQGAGGRVAKAVDDVQRGLHLADGRAQALQQALPGLGRLHAAGGAVEQAHAQLNFEPAHRLAQGRGAAPAEPGALTEATGARHRQESIQVAEVALHCSEFCTTRAHCAGLSGIGSLPRLPLIHPAGAFT